jgi:TetR/AcrR family transcriptional regulator
MAPTTPETDDVRARLLAAGLTEFAALGFEGASTRAIALAAGTHQPQINYYFESKLGLWKGVIDSLFAELDAELAGLPVDPVDALVEMCHRFVRFAARRPELNRIMVHESTSPTERLQWIVDTHSRHRFDAMGKLLAQLDPEMVPTTDPATFYYAFVGASSLMFVNAPEMAMLTGDSLTEAIVERHARAVVSMLLGSYVR